jgi:hypothetical protein
MPRFFALLLLCVSLPLAASPSRAEQPIKVAFFGFELINTSLEQTTPAEETRIKQLNDIYRDMLEKSGHYQFVPISPAIQKQIEESTKISTCNGCQLIWAREAGADLAAYGEVQKVSNLILNLNVYMQESKDGHQYFGRSVDIRGNTDETWQHGIRYLIKNYLLAAADQAEKH